MKCYRCGCDNPDNGIFCAHCGIRLTAPAELCPQCQSPLRPGSRFCQICGTSLTDKSPANSGADVQPVCRPETKKKRKIWIVALAFLLVIVVTAFVTVQLAAWPDKDNQDNVTSQRASTSAPGSSTHGSSIPDHTRDKTTEKETPAFVVVDENLIGLWSTEGPSGQLVDPDTGYATGSSYNGSWYLFRRDGTYHYVIIGSGNIISGGVVCEGKYAVGNGKIYLTDVKESWYPDPAVSGQEAAYRDKPGDDHTIYYQFIDGVDTLKIGELDYYYRVADK